MKKIVPALALVVLSALAPTAQAHSPAAGASGQSGDHGRVVTRPGAAAAAKVPLRLLRRSVVTWLTGTISELDELAATLTEARYADVAGVDVRAPLTSHIASDRAALVALVSKARAKRTRAGIVRMRKQVRHLSAANYLTALEDLTVALDLVAQAQAQPDPEKTASVLGFVAEGAAIFATVTMDSDWSVVYDADCKIVIARGLLAGS